MAFAEHVRNGVPLTRENFAEPPGSMGIIPFWFWNGDMDEQEMMWQLKEYKAKGIDAIFIHGRFGLTVPYVSDAWFEKVKAAVNMAKSIGIDAWVYDEMNWPSGTAQRKVPTRYPHLRQKYLELVALNVDGPLFTFLEATDNRYVNTGDSWPVAAFGCTEEEFQTAITHPIDLTQNLSFEKVLPWEAPAGKWRLLYFLQKEIPYYIDTLNPESTQRFIELTHERYRQAVGGHFGGTVPGFYTDEPAMHYYHVGIDNYVIPWTSQMFKIFRERRGYDLRPWLPALYLDMGPRTASVRYDFWRTLTEQYAETYYGQIREWCDRNNVLFTGHLLFEEWMRMHARCEGNIFRYLEKMHIVGVDHLYPKIGTEQEPDQHVALKLASSAAHHFGSARLLCESMGGSYWDCTLQRMKWMANWEYVLGVNLFNNHGYHYSIEGERKRDWPPSQFYHHTWWKHYPAFTSYMARISHLLSGGRHVAKVLVLYPLNSIWANYVPQKRTEVGNLTEFDFNYLTDTLLRLHYDFDFVDEDVLAEATIGKGGIGIRDEKFEVLILPPVTHMKGSTLKVIRKFIRAGGTVIADTLLPVELLETPRPDATREVQEIFGVDPRKLLAEFSAKGPVRVAVQSKNSTGHVHLLRGKGLHHGTGRKQLEQVLRKSCVPDVTISEGDVFYLHRVKDGFDIYFLANTSQEEKRNVRVTFEKIGTPELWDPNTGAIHPLHQFEIAQGRPALVLDFAPADARVIVLRKKIDAPYVSDANITVTGVSATAVQGYGNPAGKTARAVLVNGRQRIRLTSPARKPLPPVLLPQKWEFRCDGDNALLLSQWRMSMVGGFGMECAEAAPDIDDTSWLSVTQGAWEMQLPQERDEMTYPVSLWYRTSFEAEYIPSDLRVMIDGFSGSAYRLFVNGTEIVDKGKRSTLDAEIKEVPIARHVRQGRNVIAVALTARKRTDGMLDPLKLVGAFSLKPVQHGLSISRPAESMRVGDWCMQGYPFFSGTGRYIADVQVPERYCNGRLQLEVPCGQDVLEVLVNDAPAPLVPWSPYAVDLTGLVRPGINRLELRVTNTLINLLEGVRKESGVLARPSLRHFHNYELPVHRTKGDA
ncbi:MAG: hypothetical protein IT282_07900 [Bacteroidetes bacterium]|nr:hypothetical protein [Bacteroidota bacterium]